MIFCCRAGPVTGKPAPTACARLENSAGHCGSGFTREEAGTSAAGSADFGPSPTSGM